MRECGILMPVTSLASEYGIGCFSKSAFEFIDFLKNAGQSYWQILPLCPTGFADSPYQSVSLFAGNPYMISLKTLKDENLLKDEELKNSCLDGDFIDYEKQFLVRTKLLKMAFSRWEEDDGFAPFFEKNQYWLEDYALFMAIKEHFQNKEWSLWPDDIKNREEAAVLRYKETLKEEIKYHYFIQYKFSSQFEKLKKYAKEKGIKIIGDTPIYAAYDSADVWANKELFKLDKNLNPTFVAGCPPDAFSKKGQRWGNPVYNWEAHEKTGFSWWEKRFKRSFCLYDVVRIDHFRGFDQFYEIPFQNDDATVGSWEKAPGKRLFKTLKEKKVLKEVIAEDLGFIKDSVKELLKECGFPGMKVIQFAFNSRDTSDTNDHLPHNYEKNCVVYTGTHDNQTLLSFVKTLSQKDMKNLREYLCDEYTPTEKLVKPLICLALSSSAKLCIIPIQDYMQLDDKSRINTPGTTGNNWRWRAKKEDFNKSLEKYIKDMATRYQRV